MNASLLELCMCGIKLAACMQDVYSLVGSNEFRCQVLIGQNTQWVGKKSRSAGMTQLACLEKQVLQTEIGQDAKEEGKEDQGQDVEPNVSLDVVLAKNIPTGYPRWTTAVADNITSLSTIQ